MFSCANRFDTRGTVATVCCKQEDGVRWVAEKRDAEGVASASRFSANGAIAAHR